MAWTPAEENRIIANERMINKILTLLNNVASSEQVRRIAVQQQATIDSLTTRIASLEEQVAILQQQSI